MKKLNALMAAAVALVVSSGVHADAFDVSAAQGHIADSIAPTLALGGAMLGLCVLIGVGLQLRRLGKG